ncbi:hypothetical protein CY0110_21692 [Crocosphaera chwakensis CCY0110]|uniref:Uncharacterized protein n=1 Tax=Crocosphaera chwakensis CCY0110 TaxID=391612 RepID=A3IKN4_9CHRO|nr:hypothetical protein CY0110_21692 [Crocosphaera chwakensis CCY0110]
MRYTKERLFNDATLEELSELLEKATGVKVGKSTIGRINQKLNYSLKENFVCSGESAPPALKFPQCKGGARRKSRGST